MSFGNILGQIMQQGLGEHRTRDRLQATTQNLGRGGGGLDSIFTQLQGALGGSGRAAGTGQGGGFGDRARDFMRNDQVGGLSGMQIGGIGAAAGALLGGGLKGAARGGAMAVLGTLALGALRNAQAQRSGAAAPEPIQPAEIEAVTSATSERLLLRAMITAAKSDGQIDQTEMQKILGHIDDENVTDAEKRFVLDEMTKPVDIPGLATEATTPALAAEVYAASLMAIDPDNEHERQYLSDLASALKLDAETVAQLHEMTGARSA